MLGGVLGCERREVEIDRAADLGEPVLEKQRLELFTHCVQDPRSHGRSHHGTPLSG